MTTPADLAIALNRFGLGARPGDAVGLRDDPRGWLQAQLRGPAAAPLPAADGLPTSGAALAQFQTLLRAQRAAAQGSPAASPNGSQSATVDGSAAGAATMAGADGSGRAAGDPARALVAATALGRWQRQVYLSQVGARVRDALSTPTPFIERMVHFWSNHFAVSVDRRPQAVLAATLETEAIRPNVLGRFEDLLLAVVRHPSMLLYLDQPRSVGPNSSAARRVAARGRREFGLNENLAREILELHTLGVQGGYSQADVQELARALTGWTIAGFGPGDRIGEEADPRPVFVEALHEPGPRTLLGRRYPEDGPKQSEAMLADLARHPATARHLAGKLARHWIGDAPPAEAIDAIAAAYGRSDGDLRTTCAAIVDAQAAWQTPLAKFKTPWEFVVSALRAVGASAPGVRPEALAGALAELGQRTWQPGSPAGWPDTAERWAAPDALMKRVDWAAAFAQRAGALDARLIAQTALPGVLGAATHEELARADSPVQAMTLLLASPEFLRR